MVVGESMTVALTLANTGALDTDFEVVPRGNLLEDARSISSLTLHPWLMIPGFFIVATVVAFNFFGDGIRDAFDAKSRA